MDDWVYIYDQKGVLSGTLDNLDFYGHYLVEPKDDDEEYNSPIDRYMFLRVGDWSDKHDMLLCCDTSAAELYGHVVDSYDNSPWFYGGLYEKNWSSYTDYILHYLEE